jgi:hypothetical protein
VLVDPWVVETSHSSGVAWEAAWAVTRPPCVVPLHVPMLLLLLLLTLLLMLLLLLLLVASVKTTFLVVLV